MNCVGIEGEGVQTACETSRRRGSKFDENVLLLAKVFSKNKVEKAAPGFFHLRKERSKRIGCWIHASPGKEEDQEGSKGPRARLNAEPETSRSKFVLDEGTSRQEIGAIRKE